MSLADKLRALDDRVVPPSTIQRPAFRRQFFVRIGGVDRGRMLPLRVAPGVGVWVSRRTFGLLVLVAAVAVGLWLLTIGRHTIGDSLASAVGVLVAGLLVGLLLDGLASHYPDPGAAHGEQRTDESR